MLNRSQKGIEIFSDKSCCLNGCLTIIVLYFDSVILKESSCRYIKLPQLTNFSGFIKQNPTQKVIEIQYYFFNEKIGRKIKKRRFIGFFQRYQ
ncbi:unnamed protein product (macronuclear) [Paramecium tetraurelia]|uniref:Uncharacterized protein n=1 Tax=Paramecium tetraurelia TaxID=5888 RepID=A0CD43_PARTE|nr:uncharacterized protein GSPATT00037495001 [Paramecium tetraurelia]CAK68710.1 unnamed protein product [Paramecium tetraurelia]|eukprot:XP_001436107.1 hypothetical protein (macronuclear) [Paramecium tetraurelia strain d4-2]